MQIIVRNGVRATVRDVVDAPTEGATNAWLYVPAGMRWLTLGNPSADSPPMALAWGPEDEGFNQIHQRAQMLIGALLNPRPDIVLERAIYLGAGDHATIFWDLQTPITKLVPTTNNGERGKLVIYWN